MINKYLTGLTKPRIEYLPIAGKTQDPVKISVSKKATFHLNDSLEGKDSSLLKEGDQVKTGQKLMLSQDSDAYVISSVTGTISALSPYTGDFGWTGTAISVDVSEEETFDDAFGNSAEEPTLETVSGFLSGVSGNPSFSVFSNPEKPIRTIVISGMDEDLLVATSQFILQTQIEALTGGIHILKKVTGIDDITVVVPVDVMHGYGHIGAKVKAAGSEYPSGLPQMIMKDVMGQVVPEGKRCEDLGVAFFNVEAVVSIGNAFEQGRIPVSKVITLIKKDGSRVMVSVRIGTPIHQIFTAANITINNMDRIIYGGPMTGISLYSEEHPILADTDAIMIQDKDDLPFISDYPCINCGECIRICPVKIPINMLVRFLEAGHYEEAADEYDLNACIECGLCSYVCVSEIPIFQYIKLAKYELGRTNTSEAENV